MKIAIVFNRENRRVINRLGSPNRETYGTAAIKRITDALKRGGHQVMALEGDMQLIARLQDFMPSALKGERPGMVFNLSYGVQGQGRYTHVPGILEMIGIPYVGSGPVAHSLALDKVVAKALFEQSGLPTPEWCVLEHPEFEMPAIDFPLIVKPRSESVSFGIRIVHSESELRAAASTIFEAFGQPVLVERFIAGREVNVGLLGNGDPETLPPAELEFGSTGEKIYTEADKRGKSGRKVEVVCPARLSPELSQRAEELAKQAFRALGCYDCARVDMRLDDDGNFWILEINSLPSLGEHGSYVQAAEAAGMDFAMLVNRMVEVAATRYFGTPAPDATPTSAKGAKVDSTVNFLARRRDQLEKRLQTLVNESGRTHDPIGISSVVQDFGSKMQEVGLRARAEFSETHSAWLWESERGCENGTIVLVHLDVPLPQDAPTQHYRKHPETLHGDGIASSRAPLAMLEFALRALKSKRLERLPLGVLAYADEGLDCRYSRETIARITSRAKQVLVLRPGNVGDKLITTRRGQRKFRLRVEGVPHRLGKVTKKPDALNWFAGKLGELSKLSQRKQRISVATVDLRTEGMPMLLPHRVHATLLITYPDGAAADDIEGKIRALLGADGNSGPKWTLQQLSDRPPMRESKPTLALFRKLETIAQEWDIPIAREGSLWPSVAGLVPATVPVVCGLGPVGDGINTSEESINRVSLVQRTLLLAQFLSSEST